MFWLLWAVHRHMQASDLAAYEEAVRRHGHADHPVIRYTHAYLYGDGEEDLAACVTYSTS